MTGARVKLYSLQELNLGEVYEDHRYGLENEPVYVYISKPPNKVKRWVL